VNKPSGITSAQALRDLQHHFNPSELFAPWLAAEKSTRARDNHNQRKRRKEKNVQVKIGHGGTLDPLATGVLIAGVGKGTKSLQDFLLCTKVYETVVLFGTSTDTYDRVGKVLRRAPYEHITKEAVEESLKQFRGKFMQLPPLFSALKMNGKPLYEYAREGKEIPREIERRPVEVLELEMLEWMEGGTHSHTAPTDEAGYAEVNVANTFWKKENVLPASSRPSAKDTAEDSKKQDTTSAKVVGHESSASKVPNSGSVSAQVEETESKNDPLSIGPEAVEAPDSSEQKKRKMSEDQDDLVHEQPTSKRGKNIASSEDATMSSRPPVHMSSTQGLKQGDQENSPTTLQKLSNGPPAVRLRMTVTSGFYVRSLCHDLGAALGSAALMAELERTRQGEFELGKNALEWGDLSQGEKMWGPKVEGWLDDWQERTERKPLGEGHVTSISQGEKTVNAPATTNTPGEAGGDEKDVDLKLVEGSAVA
jgi:tRNA pseudouridine55 synthase